MGDVRVCVSGQVCFVVLCPLLPSEIASPLTCETIVPWPWLKMCNLCTGSLCYATTPSFPLRLRTVLPQNEGSASQELINRSQETPAADFCCSFSQFPKWFSSVQFSLVHSVVPDCESQHGRPPCPSPSPGIHPNPCPSSRWCHPTISSSVIPFFSCPQSSPASGFFSNESALHIRWPKYWSFSFNISPFSEYSRLISFWIDWLDLLAVQGTLKSLLQHHS